MNLLFVFHCFVFLSSVWTVASDSCDRGKCRTVRNVIYQDLIPHYRAVGAKIPYSCPFFKDKDRYVVQEEHKEREHSTRWTCGYCGKSFIGEIYLDGHLSRRHKESIYVEPDSVCLSDYCEIFRCDILSGVAKPTFWDVALCMEEDMIDLTQDCSELMSKCIPENLSWNASKTLTASLSKSVCSYLTCKSYYDAPDIQEEVPVGISYVVFTTMLCIGLIIYYCVAVNYFWLDTFSDSYDFEEPRAVHPESLFKSSPPKMDIPPLRFIPPRPKTKKKLTIVDKELIDKSDIFGQKSFAKKISDELKS
ncbi:hypothetical protein ACF0H5_015673 [Mactra antiquata]